MRIAFTGKMRAGKDTCANYLIDKHQGELLKFADPLYEMQEAIYEIAGLPYNETTKDRVLLQFLGTDWGRKTIDPDLWVKIMDKRLHLLCAGIDLGMIAWGNKETNLFITDARFPNEVEVLKKHGFKIIKVECNENIRIDRGATNLYHASETSLDNYNQYDWIILNEYTLESLHSELDAMLNAIS